nr:hypothetical protein [Candidatus Acidoferrales bacterium]
MHVPKADETRLFSHGASAETGLPVQSREFVHTYGVYGVTLRSHIRLALPDYPGAGLAEIELQLRDRDYFAQAIAGVPLQWSRYSTYQYALLQSGVSYVRWKDVGEFLVSGDGRRITCCPARESHHESFQVYLLGQALSFALVKCGFEPLHATCIVVEGQAVAFLGDSGFGKSSLAAYFISAGDRLLTDDLLLLQQRPEGFLAYPGPPRIKLLPDMARKYLGGVDGGVPMNSATSKLVLPLDREKVWESPITLSAIYALSPPQALPDSQEVDFEPLASRQAFLEVSRNTFNYVILDCDRAGRQIKETARIVNTVPVKWLLHPRSLEALPSVRQAIIKDLREIAGRSRP